MEPQTFRWLVPGALAVAERPGGGGRSHRIARRDGELEWWRSEGITTIVSGMRTRHGLLEAALAGFGVRWHPLVDADQGAREMAPLVAAALDALDGGPVLVHVDRPGEWLAAVDAALRMTLGLALTRAQALAQVREDGLPVGDITLALLSRSRPPARQKAA